MTTKQEARKMPDTVEKHTDPVYLGKVAGITFPPACDEFQKCVEHLSKTLPQDPNLLVTLTARPDNPHDPYAIQVAVGTLENMFVVGWIPKTHSKIISDIGLNNVKASLVDINVDFYGIPRGMKIVVERT